MDSQAKVNVEFKPAKRMKKRRELDALVNGNKMPPSFRANGRMMRNGKHELLRNDSDSSEIEEFILPEKSLIRKRNHSNICSVCITICWGFLLVVCLVGIGGLVWMCIQLKKDVDQLRIQLDRVGIQNANLPGEVRDIVAEQEKIGDRLNKLESGDQGLEKLRENVTQLIKQVSELNTTTKSLSQSVTNVQQLALVQSLPQQIKDLSKNVADLGSNLQSLQQDVGQLKVDKEKTEHTVDDIDARLRTLQLATNEQKTTVQKVDTGSHELSTDNVARLDNLVKDVSLMNVTIYTHLEELRSKYNSQQASVLELFNYTTLLNTRVTFLEVKPTPSTPTRNEILSAVSATVQTMLESLQNSSRDQETRINQYKVQSESLISILQAQISGHDTKIASLLNSLDKVNISLSDLGNLMTVLNSKLQSTTPEKYIGVAEHPSSENNGLDLQAPSMSNSTSNAGLSTTTTTLSSSSSTAPTSLISSSVSEGGNQNTSDEDNSLAANITSVN